MATQSHRGSLRPGSRSAYGLKSQELKLISGYSCAAKRTTEAQNGANRGCGGLAPLRLADPKTTRWLKVTCLVVGIFGVFLHGVLITHISHSLVLKMGLHKGSLCSGGCVPRVVTGGAAAITAARCHC